MVDKSMVTLLQSAPHTQARADKIVAAWDQYLADMRTAREKSRFEEADEAAREAVAELHELEGRIVRTRAKTPTGMLVKARMAALDPATVQRWTTWNTPSRRGWKQATSSGFRSSSTCWTCTEAMRRQQRAVYSLLLYRT